MMPQPMISIDTLTVSGNVNIVALLITEAITVTNLAFTTNTFSQYWDG